MLRKRKICYGSEKNVSTKERLSGQRGRPRLNSMRLPVVSLNRDAKLPLCIRWHAKTYRKKAHRISTLRGSNDARTERLRQMAQRRGPISVVQRRIKCRLQELRKLALKEATVDTKRVYLTLWQAPLKKAWWQNKRKVANKRLRSVAI